MTGRDALTRQKTLSVAFSVIMVLSMVAVGMAGFAGSAGATSVDNSGPGQITATPADTDAAESEHVITFPVNGTLAGTIGASNGGGADETIVVNYGDNDIIPGDVANGNNVVVDKVASDGSVTTLDGGSSYSVANNSRNQITVTLDPSGGSDVSVSQGDFIRVVIGDSTNAIDQTGASETSTVDVTVGGTDLTDQTNTLDLGLGSEAPIQLDATDGGEFHYSLQQALNADTGSTETVTISGTLDEFASQPVSATSLSAAQHDHDDTIIQGNDNTVEITDADGVDLNEQNNITYQNLNFNASDVVTDTNGNSIQAIATSASASNEVTISGNTFTNFTGTNVIDVGTGGSVNNLTITDNTLDVGDTNGIVVDANLDSDSNQFLDVSNNEITTTSGNNGLDLTVADAGTSANDDVTISSNDIAGDGSNGGNGITLAGGYSLDIEDGSVDNVQTGINLGSGSQDAINVTGVTVTNITDAGGGTPVGVDATGDLAAGAQVTISDLTIDSSPDANPGINVNSNNNDVTITGSSINDTSAGIVISEVSDSAIISDTSVTNTDGGTAIDVDDPATSDEVSVDINASTSIDQASTGIDIGATTAPLTVDVDSVTINGTSSGVDITDVADSDDIDVNVTDSTFTNNDPAALNYSATTNVNTNDPGLNVHFNTFENNAVGIGFDDGSAAGSGYQSTFNATFNDFVDNDAQGLDVQSIDSGNDGVVNANYSWWDNRDSSRIVGPYTPQNAGSQLPSPRRVYSYTRLHTGGQP